MTKRELYTIKKTATPLRQVPWVIEKDVVKVQIPKFQGKIGEALCRLIRRPAYINLNFDALGSFVWTKCDGKHTVDDIFHELQTRFQEEKLEDRLVQFLYDLNKNDLLTY